MKCRSILAVIMNELAIQFSSIILFVSFISFRNLFHKGGVCECYLADVQRFGGECKCPARLCVEIDWLGDGDDDCGDGSDD